MTETEWLNATEPQTMLRFLGREAVTLVDQVPPEATESMRRHLLRVTSRRTRGLFGCACTRVVWSGLTDERSRQAIETTELFLDGLADEGQQRVAMKGAEDARDTLLDQVGISRPTAAAMPAVFVARLEFEVAAVESALAATLAGLSATVSDASSVQAALLREVVGNPFRPLQPLPPALLGWNGGLLRQLAQAAYDQRHLPSGHLDPARLAVLADALLDAGCTDDVLQEHLREEGPHYRGCVAVDAVLGRE